MGVMKRMNLIGKKEDIGMKNNFRAIYLIIVILFVFILITSCEDTGGGGGGRNYTIEKTAIYAEYNSFQSYASLWIRDPGEVNNGVNNPISGKPLDGACVVFCDSTTHNEVVAINDSLGTYSWIPLFSNAGDIVYIKVAMNQQSHYYYFSENRQVSDSFCTITSPARSDTIVSIYPPFDVTWTLTDGNYPASALMLEIINTTSGVVTYKTNLSLTQNTFSVNKYMVSGYGLYGIRITPYFELHFNDYNVHMYSRALIYSIHKPGWMTVNMQP